MKIKANKNFAHMGKTYFVGDDVPQKVAEVMGEGYVSKPAPAKPSKSEGDK